MSTTIDTIDRDDVLNAVRDMYDAFVADDRERFDSHLHSEATTWESHFPKMFSREELDSYRDRRRPEQRPEVTAMQVHPRRIEVWGDFALAAYLLVIRLPDQRTETMRITDVLRRIDGRWRIVHHHAQSRDIPDTDQG